MKFVPFTTTEVPGDVRATELPPGRMRTLTATLCLTPCLRLDIGIWRAFKALRLPANGPHHPKLYLLCLEFMSSFARRNYQTPASKKDPRPPLHTGRELARACNLQGLATWACRFAFGLLTTLISVMQQRPMSSRLLTALVQALASCVGVGVPAPLI